MPNTVRLDDLLVSIIDENSIAPENIAAISATAAALCRLRLRPLTMSGPAAEQRQAGVARRHDGRQRIARQQQRGLLHGSRWHTF